MLKNDVTMTSYKAVCDQQLVLTMQINGGRRKILENSAPFDFDRILRLARFNSDIVGNWKQS